MTTIESRFRGIFDYRRAERRRGIGGIAWWHEGRQIVTFTGEMVNSFGRMLTGRAQVQWRDVLTVIEETGPDAFPIVTLIAALLGI